MIKVLQIALQKRIVVDSLKVMIVVGTILNLINQGDRLLALEDIQWFKFFLTYSVPYLVSTYASVQTILATQNN